MKQRNMTIDLIKGISIISIVLGHALNTDILYSPGADYVRRFVYLYHLPVFFFVSGYTFKNYDLKTFLKKKFINLYIPFVFLELFSMLSYPLWRNFNVGSSVSLNVFIDRIIEIFLFSPSGILDGAMWFVPSLFIALLAYYLIRNLKTNNKVKFILLGLLSLLSYWFIMYEGSTIMERGLVMIPFIFMGDFCKKHHLLDYIKPSYFVVLLPLLLLINRFKYFEIEISKGILANGWFYIVAVIGILFCISLAKVIEYLPVVTNIVTYTAENSFYIMALHLMMFKLIDLVYSSFINNDDLINTFPISYTNLRPVYFVLGLILSLLLGNLLKPLLNKIKKTDTLIISFKKNLQIK